MSMTIKRDCHALTEVRTLTQACDPVNAFESFDTHREYLGHTFNLLSPLHNKA